MPVDFGDVSFDLANAAYDNIRIYRDFKFGTLMHMVMTDERLYRDDHTISEQAFAFLTGADQANAPAAPAARTAPARRCRTRTPARGSLDVQRCDVVVDARIRAKHNLPAKP
mgnify:CR=1 FL=1